MGRRGVPSYWWDFHWEGNKIVSVNVESDVDYLPHPIKAFPLTDSSDFEMILDRVVQPFIKGLTEGRIDPRRVA